MQPDIPMIDGVSFKMELQNHSLIIFLLLNKLVNY